MGENFRQCETLGGVVMVSDGGGNALDGCVGGIGLRRWFRYVLLWGRARIACLKTCHVVREVRTDWLYLSCFFWRCSTNVFVVNKPVRSFESRIFLHRYMCSWQSHRVSLLHIYLSGTFSSFFHVTLLLSLGT